MLFDAGTPPDLKVNTRITPEVLLRVISALPIGDAAANTPPVAVTVHRDPFGRGESLRTTERLMHRAML